MAYLRYFIFALLFKTGHPLLEFCQFGLDIVQLKIIIRELLCQKALHVVIDSLQILSYTSQFLLKNIQTNITSIQL
jgi:hypothetical protein